MNKWALALVGAVLAAGVATAAIQSNDPSGPKTVLAPNAQQPQECAFNRLAIGPDDDSLIVWRDTAPNGLRSGATENRSELAVVPPEGKPRFFSIDGHASAINWRSDGEHIEMLLDGARYGLLAPSSSELRIWPIAGYWRKVDVKNQRWDGLREVIEDPGISRQVASYNGPFARFAGNVLVSRESRFLSARGLVDGSQFGDRKVSIFDLGSPLRLDLPNPEKMGMPEAGLPVRPVFESATGKVVGSQSLSGVSIFGPERRIEALSFGVVKDAAVSSDGALAAMLTANAAGAQFVSIERPDSEIVTTHLCGPQSSVVSSRLVPIEGERVSTAGFLHFGEAKGRGLAVRFPGGPFGSIEDNFPTETTKRLIRAGYDVLEFNAVGGREVGAARPAPRVTPENIADFTSSVRSLIVKNGYRNVVVVGESFGAFGAVDLALTLSHSTNDEVDIVSKIRTSLALLVPLSKLPEGRTMSGRKIVRGSLQERAERLAFGTGEARKRLSDWYAARVASACSLGDITIVVGAEDRRTPLEGQAACIRNQAKIVKGRGHADLFEDPEAWTWLDK